MGVEAAAKRRGGACWTAEVSKERTTPPGPRAAAARLSARSRRNRDSRVRVSRDGMVRFAETAHRPDTPCVVPSTPE